MDVSPRLAAAQLEEGGEALDLRGRVDFNLPDEEMAWRKSRPARLEIESHPHQDQDHILIVHSASSTEESLPSPPLDSVRRRTPSSPHFTELSRRARGLLRPSEGNALNFVSVSMPDYTIGMVESSNKSPRPDGGSPMLTSTTTFGTPKASSSSRVAQTPRLGAHHRKNSSQYRARQTSPLPTFGGSSKRALTGGSPDPNRYGDPSNFTLRNLILRPLLLLSRRGPLLPLILFATILLFIFASWTSPSTQNVKRRVQGAVGPYIPQRAAEAIAWGAKVPPPATRPKGALAKHEQALKNIPVEVPAEEMPLPPRRKDGRILIKEGEKHPIPALMKRAKQQWKDLKGRQSKTFEQAVNEYIRRYKRRPPKGFDQWYAFAKAHKVLMIDEFDIISKDMELFHAFRPKDIRARVNHLNETFDQHWTIRVEKGKIYREGPRGHHDRAKGIEYLASRFVDKLPDMSIVYNGHDGARVPVAAEERMRLMDLVAKKEYDDFVGPPDDPFGPKERGPEPHWGMSVFCPPGSAVRQPGFDYGWAPDDSTGLEMPENPTGAVGTLLDDFKGYMDVCNNPQYRHFHCTTSWVYSHQLTPVMPLFTPGVQTTFGDIHSIITEQLDLEQEHDPTWEERAFTSLVWRGQTSGPYWESKTPWRTTQRARLHLLSHQEGDSRKVVVTSDDDTNRLVDMPNYRLNPLFLDAGMVGPAVQCDKDDGTCDKMYEVFQGYDKRLSLDRASLYKYALDIDGNSWSGRFRRLMQSNAAVVKATVFPEFWTDWAIPWLHFIPMQVDYSDMWNIMSFFRGGLNGEGAHDALGKEIAMAGKEWVRLCYRWPDLEAFQYRLMLEYGRIWNDGREDGSNDYMGDGTIEPVWDGTIKL